VNTRGLYPAGEGAGYGGGILSAAVDGIRVAEALALDMTGKARRRLTSFAFAQSVSLARHFRQDFALQD
jgi:hypothetical protein